MEERWPHSVESRGATRASRRAARAEGERGAGGSSSESSSSSDCSLQGGESAVYSKSPPLSGRPTHSSNSAPSTAPLPSTNSSTFPAISFNLFAIFSAFLSSSLFFLLSPPSSSTPSIFSSSSSESEGNSSSLSRSSAFSPSPPGPREASRDSRFCSSMWSQEAGDSRARREEEEGSGEVMRLERASELLLVRVRAEVKREAKEGLLESEATVSDVHRKRRARRLTDLPHSLPSSPPPTPSSPTAPAPPTAHSPQPPPQSIPSPSAAQQSPSTQPHLLLHPPVPPPPW